MGIDLWGGILQAWVGQASMGLVFKPLQNVNCWLCEICVLRDADYQLDRGLSHARLWEFVSVKGVACSSIMIEFHCFGPRFQKRGLNYFEYYLLLIKPNGLVVINVLFFQ